MHPGGGGKVNGPPVDPDYPVLQHTSDPFIFVSMNDAHLRYPIGTFKTPDSIQPADLARWIATIADFPRALRKLVSPLTEQQLDTAYRIGGWTVRQVVHHCADSHLNAYVRFKLALTEDNPVIKPYEEARWAELPDSRLPIGASLSLLDGLHERWSMLLSGLDGTQLQRTYTHPEHGKAFPLDEAIGMYAWHCAHHLAHVRLVTG